MDGVNISCNMDGVNISCNMDRIYGAYGAYDKNTSHLWKNTGECVYCKVTVLQKQWKRHLYKRSTICGLLHNIMNAHRKNIINKNILHKIYVSFCTTFVRQNASRQQTRKARQEYYQNVYTKCYAGIRDFQRDYHFKVPKVELWEGSPEYHDRKVIAYITMNLKKLGFDIRFHPPDTVVINWYL
jgi:hypothetical protein